MTVYIDRMSIRSALAMCNSSFIPVITIAGMTAAGTDRAGIGAVMAGVMATVGAAATAGVTGITAVGTTAITMDGTIMAGTTTITDGIMATIMTTTISVVAIITITMMTAAITTITTERIKLGKESGSRSGAAFSCICKQRRAVCSGKIGGFCA